MRKKKKNNSAFTLIELLVTTVIASVISVALFTAFSNGIKLWRRVNTRLAGEEFALFSERFRADISSSFVFTGIACSGSETELRFPGLVAVPGQESKGIGRLSYIFDGDTIIRTAEDYAQVYADRQQQGRRVLGGLKKIALEYYFFDSVQKEFRWATEWAEKGLPRAVRLTAEFQDGRRAGRTFTVPVGGSVQ